MSARPPRAVVLYDRDCGFCRWSLARLLAFDRRRALRPVALQEPEAERLLPGMDRERRFASAHLVAPDGRVHSGGAAAAPILRLLPGGAPLARLADLVPGLMAAVYGVVAGNRDKLGPRLPEGAKERATEQIDRHAAEAETSASR